jgi:hypothetical protein
MEIAAAQTMTTAIQNGNSERTPIVPNVRDMASAPFSSLNRLNRQQEISLSGRS